MSAHARRLWDHARARRLRALLDSWKPIGEALTRQQAALVWLDGLIPRQRRHSAPREHLPRIITKARRVA